MTFESYPIGAMHLSLPFPLNVNGSRLESFFPLDEKRMNDVVFLRRSLLFYSIVLLSGID